LVEQGAASLSDALLVGTAVEEIGTFLDFARITFGRKPDWNPIIQPWVYR